MQHYFVNLIYVLTLLTPHRTAASPLGALRVPHVVAAQRLFTHDEMSYFYYKPKDSLHSAYTEDELEWAWGYAAGHTKGKGAHICTHCTTPRALGDVGGCRLMRSFFHLADVEYSWRAASHMEELMSDIEVW